MLRSGALAVLLAGVVSADFVYYDFNDTTGLDMNGDAATTSCHLGEAHPYNQRHGTADGTGEIPGLLIETATTFESNQVATNDPSESELVTQQLAILGHRRSFSESPDPDGCNLRVRLTPSQPFRRGTVMRKSRVPVQKGWETGFTFVISDHSRVCRRLRDPDFSTQLYQSCYVHGGDGIAFVMHNDPNKTHVLGEGGEKMGYSGIRNALAVELDTWYNPEIGDLFRDHITVQASGPDGELVSNQTQMLGSPRPRDIGDGVVHAVKIQYFDYLKYDLLPHFSATPNLTPFLKDAGEARRMGTLVVYYDDMTTPVVAIPINLNVALRLQQGQAYIGFASATGRAWERHDLTSWYFCREAGCPRTGLGMEDLTRTYDGIDYMEMDEVMGGQQTYPERPSNTSTPVNATRRRASVDEGSREGRSLSRGDRLLDKEMDAFVRGRILRDMAVPEWILEDESAWEVVSKEEAEAATVGSSRAGPLELGGGGTNGPR